jgi:hypothetical protein
MIYFFSAKIDPGADTINLELENFGEISLENDLK